MPKETNKNTFSLFSNLPDDCQKLIISYLNRNDKNNLCLVNKPIKKLTTDLMLIDIKAIIKNMLFFAKEKIEKFSIDNETIKIASFYNLMIDFQEILKEKIAEIYALDRAIYPDGQNMLDTHEENIIRIIQIMRTKQIIRYPEDQQIKQELQIMQTNQNTQITRIMQITQDPQQEQLAQLRFNQLIMQNLQGIYDRQNMQDRQNGKKLQDSLLTILTQSDKFNEETNLIITRLKLQLAFILPNTEFTLVPSEPEPANYIEFYTTYSPEKDNQIYFLYFIHSYTSINDKKICENIRLSLNKTYKDDYIFIKNILKDNNILTIPDTLDDNEIFRDFILNFTWHLLLLFPEKVTTSLEKFINYLNNNKAKIDRHPVLESLSVSIYTKGKNSNLFLKPELIDFINDDLDFINKNIIHLCFVNNMPHNLFTKIAYFDNTDITLTELKAIRNLDDSEPSLINLKLNRLLILHLIFESKLNECPEMLAKIYLQKSDETSSRPLLELIAEKINKQNTILIIDTFKFLKANPKLEPNDIGFNGIISLFIANRQLRHDSRVFFDILNFSIANPNFIINNGIFLNIHKFFKANPNLAWNIRGLSKPENFISHINFFIDYPEFTTAWTLENALAIFDISDFNLIFDKNFNLLPSHELKQHILMLFNNPKMLVSFFNASIVSSTSINSFSTPIIYVFSQPNSEKISLWVLKKLEEPEVVNSDTETKLTTLKAIFEAYPTLISIYQSANPNSYIDELNNIEPKQAAETKSQLDTRYTKKAKLS